MIDLTVEGAEPVSLRKGEVVPYATRGADGGTVAILNPIIGITN